MKFYIRLLCAGMLIIHTCHNALAKEESDYVTSANVRDYNTQKDSTFELSDNQKIALGLAGAIATGAAAYGAYQYVTADDLSTTPQGQNSNLRTEEEVRQALPQSPEMKKKLDEFAPTVPPRSHGEYEKRLEKYDQWRQDQAAQGIYVPSL